jgi:hypothetical protein
VDIVNLHTPSLYLHIGMIRLDLRQRLLHKELDCPRKLHRQYLGIYTT